MAKIKTRDTVKDIKTFDRAADISTHMKNTLVKSKNTAEQTQEPGYDAHENYATDKSSDAARDTAEQAAHKLKNPGKKASENIDKAKQNFQDAKRNVSDIKNAVKKPTADQLKKEMVKRARNTARHTTSRARQTADKSIKTVQRSEKTIKQSAKTIKATGKGAAKTAQKSVKTAERTAKTAIKTTQQAAKATQKTAQATAKAAAQASKVAAKAAIQAAKITIKVTIATVKAIIAATKALIAAIIAGGWIAVIIILIICIVGLIVGSCFGIFFSGEDCGTGQTMQTAVQEINADYDSSMEEIKASNHYDILEISGSRVAWKEVLAVYAVKTTSDSADPQEVATIDSGKKELLNSIFWEMNEISYRTQAKTEVQITESDDGHGNIVETEIQVTRTYLYITVTHKTTDEMAEQYGFTVEQKAQLAELLSDKYADLWSSVIYGIHEGSEEIVNPFDWRGYENLKITAASSIIKRLKSECMQVVQSWPEFKKQI